MFTRFLSVLLKDQPYVELAYMMGILPISKYSSGSELNMFVEYLTATREKYSEYFGFTDEEVDGLYQKYLNMQKLSYQNIQIITPLKTGLEMLYFTGFFEGYRRNGKSPT